MLNINYYRCLHGASPLVYHEGIAASAQEWAEKPDKGSIHSGWGSSAVNGKTDALIALGSRSRDALISSLTMSYQVLDNSNGHSCGLTWFQHCACLLELRQLDIHQTPARKKQAK